MHQASLCDFQRNSNLGWKTYYDGRNIEDTLWWLNIDNSIESTCIINYLVKFMCFYQILVDSARMFCDADCSKLLLESMHSGVSTE